jgi:hypothetical protein
MTYVFAAATGLGSQANRLAIARNERSAASDSSPTSSVFSVTSVPPWCLVLDPLLSAMEPTALCLLPSAYCLLPTTYRQWTSPGESVYCKLHAVLPLLAPVPKHRGARRGAP